MPSIRESPDSLVVEFKGDELRYDVLLGIAA
jgi:hypothetical protein